VKLTSRWNETKLSPRQTRLGRAQKPRSTNSRRKNNTKTLYHIVRRETQWSDSSVQGQDGRLLLTMEEQERNYSNISRTPLINLHQQWLFKTMFSSHRTTCPSTLDAKSYLRRPRQPLQPSIIEERRASTKSLRRFNWWTDEIVEPVHQQDDHPERLATGRYCVTPEERKPDRLQQLGRYNLAFESRESTDCIIPLRRLRQAANCCLREEQAGFALDDLVRDISTPCAPPS